MGAEIGAERNEALDGLGNRASGLVRCMPSKKAAAGMLKIAATALRER